MKVEWGEQGDGWGYRVKMTRWKWFKSKGTKVRYRRYGQIPASIELKVMKEIREWKNEG